MKNVFNHVATGRTHEIKIGEDIFVFREYAWSYSPYWLLDPVVISSSGSSSAGAHPATASAISQLPKTYSYVGIA